MRISHAILIEKNKEMSYGSIYSLVANELKVFRDYLNANLIKDWIRRSESSAEAFILFIRKKNDFLYLCVNYKDLNRITIKNKHSLSLINEILDRLSEIMMFIKLDLRDAYNCIHIKKKNEWKTAFCTRYNHYEYLVIFFGLINAPIMF